MWFINTEEEQIAKQVNHNTGTRDQGCSDDLMDNALDLRPEVHGSAPGSICTPSLDYDCPYRYTQHNSENKLLRW